MKLNDLFESDEYALNIINAKSYDDIVEIIDDECQDMLAAFKKANTVLLRGLYADNKPTIHAKIRPDRKPVEMDPKIHDALHAAFLQIGLKATRKNSIFCTTSRGIAEDWGSSTYIVFVKDGWSATAFSEIPSDYAFYELKDIAKLTNNNVDDMVPQIENLGPMKIETTAGLVRILKQHYEDILVTGDSYYALKLGVASTNYILKKLGLKNLSNIPVYHL